MKEQHAPEVLREVALLNTDNEFNREINEEDIDFNIPGLPHSTVKQLHGASVRELIQKIENHPHRHALQRDLQQSQSFNPFSQESEEMIHEVGNIDLGIHDRFIRDEKFRKNMFDTGRTEEMCRKMDELANEDHTHHLTPEEIRRYRANWWIRSNNVGSDTMPVRHRTDFKQALSTLRHHKDQEDAAHEQRWTQSYSSSWWNCQESWWHSSYEHHHEDVPSLD